MRCYESIESDVNLYWLPGLWFAQNLQEAFMKGHIKDTYAVKLIMEVTRILLLHLFHQTFEKNNVPGIRVCLQELLDFRGKCGTLWTYSWISIPLIYTQVHFAKNIFIKKWSSINCPWNRLWLWLCILFFLLALWVISVLSTRRLPRMVSRQTSTMGFL